jgi:alkyl hydroperoxide reductase subunit AhpC
VRPVLHDQQRSIDDERVVGRNLQLIDRLVEAGVCVDVRAEAHPNRLHEGDDVLFREV